MAHGAGNAVEEARTLAARLSSIEGGTGARHRGSAGAPRAAARDAPGPTEFEEHRLRETLRRGGLVWAARVQYPLETFDRELEQLKARLRGVGELVSTLPGPVADSVEALSFVLLIGSGAGEAGCGSPSARRRWTSGQSRSARNAGPLRRPTEAGRAARRPRPPVRRARSGSTSPGRMRSWTTWASCGSSARPSAACRMRASCLRGPGQASCSGSSGGWCGGWTFSRTGFSRRGWFRSARCSTGCSASSGGWRARRARRWCSPPPAPRCRSTSAWWRS